MYILVDRISVGMVSGEGRRKVGLDFIRNHDMDSGAFMADAHSRR